MAVKNFSVAQVVSHLDYKVNLDNLKLCVTKYNVLDYLENV